jgi:hypothetical protein
VGAFFLVEGWPEIPVEMPKKHSQNRCDNVSYEKKEARVAELVTHDTKRILPPSLLLPSAFAHTL